MALQRRAKSSLRGLHDSLAKERGSGACTSARAVGWSLKGSARGFRLRIQRVFGEKTGQASVAFTKVSKREHAALVGLPAEG